AEADGFLTRLDLRLTPQRVGVPLRLADEQLAGPACGGQPRAGQCIEREKGETGSCYQSDRDPDDDEHARSLPRAGVVPAGVRVVRAGARRSSSTATPDMLESGRARLARASHAPIRACPV